MVTTMLNARLLRRLWSRSLFPESGGLRFFGLRGASPEDFEATGFAVSRKVRHLGTDHLHMRCTIGQWRGEEIAVFAGSTVPHRSAIAAALPQGGIGANQLLPGFYRYQKGMHGLGRPSAHRAFRQVGYFPVRRTGDDLDYDAADMVDLRGEIVWDNLHCAWAADPEQPIFASNGCQVVAGYPKSARQPKNVGPWARFYANGYEADQALFDYALFDAAEVIEAAGTPDSLAVRPRFGARHELVAGLQRRLADAGHQLATDGSFGRQTLAAVIAHQTRTLGPAFANGVVGSETAAALGLTLPNIRDLHPGVR
jgi:hypothetical protein